MAKQTINIGASPNDGTGTPLRTAFDYTNLNFTELYTATGPSGNNIVVPGNATITGDLTVDTTTLFVKSSNDRVGIGTVTPLSKLHIGSGTGLNNLGVGLSMGATANFYEAFDGTKTLIVGTDSSQAGVKVGSLTNHPLYLVSNNTPQLEITHPGLFVFNDGAGGTRMTLNSTGLGVGVAPTTKLHVLMPDAATADIARFQQTNQCNLLIQGQQGGQNLGGSNGVLFSNAVGRIGFRTATTTGDAQVLIESNGNLLVGTTGTVVSAISRFRVSAAGAAAVDAKTTLSPDAVADLWNAATTGDNQFVRFWTEATPTNRGSITYNRAGGLVAYNTTSDYRAKDIIGPVSNSGSVIDSLKVYIGKMKGASVERPMLIAHEAQEVAPYAVTGTKDEVDADGKPKYQQIDVSSFVPLLIAEIQSLRTRVAALEA